MAQKTDLNVSPYYDDFDINDNFHRVLFRPGFAVQAKELTQLQSILQNQIERHGQNVFRDGTYKSMPLSFPKLKKIGSKKVFSFRFEKFTSNMTYDPVFAFTEKREPSRVSVWGLIEIVVVIMVCTAVFFSLWLYFK